MDAGHPPRISRTRIRSTLACLLLLFAVAESAGKCKVGCHGMQPGKAYQVGHTYVYSLEGLSVTSVTEAQGDATLKLAATVELSVKPDCAHQLRLKNVLLNGEPPSTPDVERYAVQFNYHDGHIDTELCAEPGDSQASLNIKRAVISMFQSAVMQDSGSTTHHEIDVMGACPTDFVFRKEGESLIVHKNRDLSQCAYRESINQDLVSASTDTAAGIKTSPLLGSQQQIEQRFKRGILNKAMSKEVYQLKPFSNGEAGAKTGVGTTLTLKSEKGESPTAAVSQPKSLIFEAPHPVLESSVDAIGDALKAAKAEVANGVKADAASMFAELVKVLRLSNKNDILSVYQKVRAGAGFDKEDKKLLLDALFRAGSGESAEVAVELVKNKEVTGVQALLFYASLALVRHVNLPSVVAVTSLLNQPNLPRLGYLGVGQVVGKYCQEHPCENVPEVKEAVHKIREKVGNGKAKTKEQENMIVSALKALGNTQFLDDATLQKLANIGADRNVRNRVRVAAIEALPTRCSMKWKNILFKTLADREEDSEIRIKAYLSLVACPCEHVAGQLKEVLDKETVNQVGSFIQTHLRNLRASTDPSKQAAKVHLGLIKPRAKFPEDIRKFSFNDELSYKMDAFGLGSSVESNVIYSQNSYVPRSVHLNASVELFGRNFNFLELDTRMENLDRLIENLVGPKGQLWEEYDKLKTTSESTASKLGERIKQRYEKLARPKREVKQAELDRFAKNVHLRGNQINQDLDLDLSMKLFGVELAYLNYQGDGQDLMPGDIIEKVFRNIEDGFEMAKNMNYDLENYLQFLDAELIYPTSLGSALCLGVTGTSAGRMKIKGKLDIPSILWKSENVDLRVAIEPSVSVTIVGNMVVRGLGVESGMRVVGTLHTATSADVSVNMLNGKGIDVNVGFPKKKQELISVSSKVLFSSGPKGNAYVAPKFGKGKEYADCFDQLSSALGLTICGHLSFPYENLANIQQKPMFPLSGPAKFMITVENNDIANYHFKAYLDVEERSLEVVLDTPKSKKQVSLVLQARLKPGLYVKASLDSPIKKAFLEIVLKNTPQEHTLSVTAQHEQNHYQARIGAIADGSKYRPVLEYEVPEHIAKLASKKTGLATDKKYNVQGTVDISDYEGGHKYHFDKVALTAGGKKVVLFDGSVIATPKQVSMDANIEYVDKSLALKLEGKSPSKNNYALSVSALPSTDPTIGFNLNWEFKAEDKQLEQKLVFVHGPDLNSDVNRLALEQKAAYSLSDFLLFTSNKLTYPAMKIKLKFDGKLTHKTLDADVEVKYEKLKFGTELSVKTNVEKPNDYEVELEAELMENSLKFESKRAILDEHKSKLTNSLVITPGGKYDAVATVVHDLRKNNVNLQLDGDVNLNGKKIKVDTGLECNSQAINSRAFVKVDGVKYVEFILRTRQAPNPSGNMNLNLKNYLSANGQYLYKNGKGNGDLSIEIPKIKRKVKATGDLTVSGSEYVGNFELLYDAEKDPGKRIKLSTVSDITDTTLNTKNVLEVLAHKLEVNAKGKLENTFVDGNLQLDMDVTLPNGRFLVYKLKRNSAKKDGKYNVQIDAELADHAKKGEQPRKFAYTADVKDLNLKSLTFQGEGRMKYVNVDGKNTNVAWVGKNLVQPDNQRQNQLSIEVSGANVPRKFLLDLLSNMGSKGGSMKVGSSLGDDLSLASSGSYVPGNKIDQPCKVEVDLDLKLPSEKLKNLKMQCSTSLLESIEGNGLVVYSDSMKLTYNDDKTISYDGYLKLVGGVLEKGLEVASEGEGKFVLNVLQLPTMKTTGNYKFVPTQEKKTADLELNASYGDKEAKLQSHNEYLPDLAVVNVNGKASLLLEKLRNVEMQLVYKRHKNENKQTADLVVVADGAKYTMNSEIQQQDANYLFHVLTTCPTGKSEVLSRLQKLGSKEYEGEWKVDTPKGFVATDAHVNLNSIDDFAIKVNFDSDKIKHRKIHAEIANKPTAKAEKRITIVVTSDGQNLVTGSTNYKKHEESGKTVIEGNGSLKVGDNTKSSSFKYTRQQLTRDKDGEAGVAMVLNANFGPSSIVGELKLTNKEVHVFESYCEQSKDCAHFNLQSVLDTEQKSVLKHRVIVEIDLKKFNVPAEFGLKTSTELKNAILDHVTSLYLHSTKDKTEYTYQFYVHPKEAASILTLPSREIATVLTYDLPKTKQTGAYKLDLSHYLDRKNKPSDKTSLTVNGDVNIDKNVFSLNGETKFTYPTQSKEMVVKGKLHCGGQQLLDASLDIDVFAKKSQKITVAANLQRQSRENGNNVTGLVEVNSRGQHLKLDLKSHLVYSTKEVGFGSFFTYNDVRQKPKTLGTLFSADINHVYLLVTLPDKELIREDWKLQFNKNQWNIDGELSLLGQKPEVTSIELKDTNQFKFLSYPKDNPNDKLSVSGQIVLGQLAEIHADAFKDGAKKNLFHASIHLDDKQFLKPDIGYNKENIAQLLDDTKNKNVELVKKMKEVQDYVTEQVQAEGADFLNHLKKAQPNMKPLMDYYQAELNKIKEEIYADESIKEVQAILDKYFAAIVASVTETMKQAVEGLEKLQKQLNEIMEHLKEAVKSVYPQLKESYDKIFQQGVEIFDAATKLANTYLQAILGAISEHQQELQDLMGVVSEMTRDFAKIITKSLEQIKKEVEEFWDVLVKQLKALPIYEMAKEKLESLKTFQISETAAASFEELCNSIKKILPTEELYQMVDLVCQYIGKRMRNEKVDDAGEIKKIYTSAVSALQSIIALVEKQTTIDNILDLVQIRQPIDLSLLSKLPGISSLKVSVLNLLRNRELPTPLDLYYAYRPTLYPTDILPPFSKTGIVISGGHFITFDGRHLSMSGSCSYVLAQDMQDGNFSVVANFNNGVLNSITLTEPKESITIKSNQNMLINNKPADFPVHRENLHAYLVKPFVNVKSDYGVRVTCSDESPLICAVHVSGFYLGKLRGLLGDGNNEPYDDFTLPSGKITENEAEFGNAYKLKPDCPAATVVEQASHAATCTDYFSGENSPLQSCFKYVNPTKFRNTCDRAANTPEGACLVAGAYHYMCYTVGIMSTNVPSSCTNCKVGANAVNVGDSFSVKVPKKEADLIFVVEQEIPNEKVFKEMVVPLMSELREELKHQGMTDVHVGLIGFSEKMEWPQHYTLNSDTNINGEVKNMEFKEGEPLMTLQEAKNSAMKDKIKYLLQRLSIELGTFELTDAYEEAIRYPFRPGAARAVIGVIANPCEKSPLPISLQQIRLLLGQKIYRDLGLTYFHVSFPGALEVNGKPQKNIVAYDEDSVYTFADSKKKPLSGNTDAKNNLVVPIDDVCANFAVSSGGAVFSSDNFLEAKPNQKKQFVQVAARRIADSLANLELQKDCSCEFHYGMVGRSQCKIVGRKEKVSHSKHTKGGVKG